MKKKKTTVLLKRVQRIKKAMTAIDSPNIYSFLIERGVSSEVADDAQQFIIENSKHQKVWEGIGELIEGLEDLNDAIIDYVQENMALPTQQINKVIKYWDSYEDS